MSYLLDTNVLFESARSHPSKRVERWLADKPQAAIHISVLSLGEIRRGIEVLADGRQREQLRAWLTSSLAAQFGPNILPVTQEIAECWGRLVAAAGRSLPVVDTLIAATALTHQLSIVTRNARDFRFPGLDVINPWSGG